MPRALSSIRICDFTGQLAGAGATRFLAAFGAQVIRIEDPTNQGRWDILRGGPPFVDKRRGTDLGGAFNNHNVEKLGITLNLRSERARELLCELVRISDVVTENFAAGVLKRRGFDYERFRALREDIIYVSNCGFGHSGPYKNFKSWGPLVQAISGLTFTSSLPGQPPAGWGYSYMDHVGAYGMTIAILAALYHRAETGEGQWVDLACTETASTLHGPALLDFTANEREVRASGTHHSNRSPSPAMAPHGIYPAAGDDAWIAIACRSDEEWTELDRILGGELSRDAHFSTRESRLAHQDELDAAIATRTRTHDAFALSADLQRKGVPASPVRKPAERIDQDPNTREWGLWPEVDHSEMGKVRVDGLPIHLSQTDWHMSRGAPCVGEHNEYVYGELLGRSSAEIETLREEGVL